jgi:hypothetical protein
MAKLSAHGHEIGTIYLTTSAKRYMSDGKVLKNIGFGWKLYATCKNDPAEAFKKAEATGKEFLAARPMLAAYRKELHAMAGLCKRWKLHAAVQLMPEDCDGVWSECCDGYGDNVHADVDEVGNLCRLYLSAVAESLEMAKVPA